MKPIERLAVGIENPPWDALWKVVIGFLMLPLFHVLLGHTNSILLTFGLFIAVLVALRVVPVVIRRMLPFSSEAQDIWRSRRNLSKQYDSYAWQKLFWIGLGLACYAVIGKLRYGELELTLLCLLAGGAGLVVWRRTRATE